jgi:prepilin-type N-terminal cleavage/methylation domain-containing protein
MSFSSKRGFSLIEILAVLGMVVVLMGMVLVRLDESKDRARDNAGIARVEQLTLALQDYMTACRSYPEELDVSTDNTRGSGVCSVTFGDIVGGYEENLSDFQYMPLQSASGYCDGFHLSIQLKTSHPRLDTDDDFIFTENDDVWNACGGAEIIRYSDADLFFDIKRP